MLVFKDIQLEDQELINEYFYKLQNQNSECSFTNMFIWRKCYHVQWALVEDFLVILTCYRDESWILPPYGDYEHGNLKFALRQIKEYFDHVGKPFLINAITPEFSRVLDKKAPNWFGLEEERDLFDYIYLGENLRELKGKKFHSKRNHLNNFRKSNPDFEYETLNSALIPEVKDFLDRWCAKKECKGDFNRELQCEKKAVWEALEHFGELPYVGAVIRISGIVQAFTLGEQINNDTVLIHIEKADSEIQGLYGAVNQQYLMHEWPHITYVNREEDMGEAGLRKAKLSYNPVDFARKYKGTYKEKDLVYHHQVSTIDNDSVRALWEYCFNDSPAFLNWYFSRYYHKEYTIGSYYNRRLIASAQLIPYTISLRGKPVDTAYVVGVDTAPEFRRGGIAGDLLQACLEKMRKNRQPISLLMPFEGSFYYRHQWSFCYVRHQYEMELTEISELRKDCGKMIKADAYKEIKTLNKLYREYHKDHNGYVLRNDEKWNLLIQERQLETAYCYLFYEKQTAEGYLFYSFTEDTFLVQEMAYSNENAKRGILNFIYSHRSHVKKLEWSASEDDFSYLKFNSGRAKSTLKPFLMTRVVDVIQIWEALNHQEDIEPFRIQINDQTAHWNHGVFQFQVEDGKGKAVQIDDSTDWDVSMGIEAFTCLIMGSLRMDQLIRQDQIDVSNTSVVEMLGRHFPQMVNDIVECF